MSYRSNTSRVFSKENVIFDVPSEVFDERRVKQWRKNILSYTDTSRPWVLLSIPDVSIAITPDGVASLAEALRHFSDRNCVAIAILTNHTSSKIVTFALEKENLTDKVCCSESMENICQYLEEKLENSDILKR